MKIIIAYILLSIEDNQFPYCTTYWKKSLVFFFLMSAVGFCSDKFSRSFTSTHHQPSQIMQPKYTIVNWQIV